MSVARVAWAVLEKDLRAELRGREALVGMVVFGVLTVVVFSFAFGAASAEAGGLAPGMFWVACIFAGFLGLNRSFAVEREAGAVTALLLAPADRGAIYLGKMAANALLIVALEMVVFPALALFFNLAGSASLARLTVVGALGALAFAAAGTIFAAISAQTTRRDVLLPLLLIPAAAPILLAAVEGTAIALRGNGQGYAAAVRLLTGFTVIYATASYLLFEYVIEE